MFGKGRRKTRTKDVEQGRNGGGVRGPGRRNERLAKRILGKDSGRRVFGFACSPDIHAQMKLLAGELQVPVFALAEHCLQLSVGLVAKAKENPEERELLRKHLVEVHVEARTIEKFNFYDEQLAKDLNEQRLWRFDVESAVRQIVIDFTRKGLKPRDIGWYIDYGYRCFAAVLRGRPVPKDIPPWIGPSRRSQPSSNRAAGEKEDTDNGTSEQPGQ
jgi:hypothetical protein